jgi:type II secretory pathway component PulC
MNLVSWIDHWVDLKLLRKILLILVAIPLVLIPADAIRLSRGKLLIQIPAKQAGGTVKATLPLEPVSAYQSVFEKSSLFGNLANAAAPMIKASILELAKDFRLKGVVIASEPEALIEDARTQKTTFVHVGQALGELSVKEIREGLVVLEYLGEETRMEIQ